MVGESVLFNGIKFTCYPNAARRTSRLYYYPDKKYRIEGIQGLHQEIWKAANGPIPDGCHIHHKDTNPLNNDLRNLELVTPKQHGERHAEEFRSVRQQHADQIRPFTKAWHASDEGRAVHSRIGKESWDNREPNTYACQECGNRYESLARTRKVLFKELPLCLVGAE